MKNMFYDHEDWIFIHFFPFKEEIAPPVDSEPRTKNMALPANQATGKDYVVSWWHFVSWAVLCP